MNSELPQKISLQNQGLLIIAQKHFFKNPIYALEKSSLI